MKNKTTTILSVVVVLVTVLCITGPAEAGPPARPNLQGGAPTVVSYQGQVIVDGSPYNGIGYFMFAIVDADENVYWTNDGQEPAAGVPLTVTDGLFNVLLGDTDLPNMTALPAGAFDEPERYLRAWFSTDGSDYLLLAPDQRIAAVPYALQAQEAVDADTLDGLQASELGAHYQNVVVVAKSGGDYTSVQAAIDGITDAAADNAYLVWVAPGVYSEVVTMKPYVHLQGAGQGATVITSTASSSAWPPDQATLILASDTSLRDLTAGNGGTGSDNVALLATAGTTRTLVADVTARALGGGVINHAIFLSGSGTGVTLQQVTALAENGSLHNYGLYNYDGAAAMLRGGSFTARGGNNTGIFNSGSSTTLEAESVTALAENGDFSVGLCNNGAAAAMLRGGSFTARGGYKTQGIYNSSSSTTLDAESVTVLAENGSSRNYGLYNYFGAAAMLRGGSFTARGGDYTWGIYNDGDLRTTELEAENVTVLGENGGNWNYGLGNYLGAAATLRGGSFTARGGEVALGIYNDYGSTTLEAEGVTALGENGSITNYGLWNSDAAANVTQSVLEGATYSVLRDGGSVTVSNSRLVGGAVSGAVTCVAVSRGTTFNASGCP